MKPPLWLIIFSVLFAFSPLLPLFVAIPIAQLNSCELHEGFANPCVVLGVDLGEIFYVAAVLPWLSFITIPIGGIFSVIGFIWLLIAFFKKPKSENTS